MSARTTEPPRAAYQSAGLLAGPALAALMLLLPAPAGLPEAGWRAAALGALMAVWWATEAIPVAATALLPIAVAPLLGVSGIRSVTAPYAHPTIFLFLGGFLIALAMQRWALHRRIALAVIRLSGRGGASLVGGFMLASALLSMWITNTSTAMMLLPIAMSVVTVVRENVAHDEAETAAFPVAMMLGVAYGASIGGMATIVGTPPNALLVAFMDERFAVEIGFAQWMLVGVPLSACLLPVCWWLLTRRLYPVHFSTGPRTRAFLERLRREQGPMRRPERRVALIFGLLVAAWMARPLLERIDPLSGLSDAGLAMLAGVALFVVPSGARRREDAGPGAREAAPGGEGAARGGERAGGSSFLMRWRDTAELPWGVLILFGGGLSLAEVVSTTGLAEWLGRSMTGLGAGHYALLVVALTALVIFLTELTSNFATTATFLPVVAAVAAESGHAPIALTAPVALAASCAFMLPVATPPNAVVFASGMIRIPQMVRAGLFMNVIGIVVVSLVALLLAPRVLG